MLLEPVPLPLGFFPTVPPKISVGNSRVMLQTASSYPTGVSDNATNQPQWAAPPSFSYPTSNNDANQPQRAALPGSSYPASSDARNQPTQAATPGIPHPLPASGVPWKPCSRANALIATLNMNGRASPDCRPGPLSKWTMIYRVLWEKKISILCLQETHLENKHVQRIETLFGRHLKVMNSKYPTNPSSTAGVAFVVNKELVNTLSMTTTELIPGQAMILTINWHDNNSPHAHAYFWSKIQNNLDHHPHRPDLLLGDFNVIEDAIDRAPAHKDYEPATSCL